MIYTGINYLCNMILNIAVLTTMFGLTRIEMLRSCIIVHNVGGMAMTALFSHPCLYVYVCY